MSIKYCVNMGALGTVFDIYEIGPDHNDTVNAAVTIIASVPFQDHARSKRNKQDYRQQILKSVSNFSFKSASIYNIWI